jgi:hypothetical protein
MLALKDRMGALVNIRTSMPQDVALMKNNLRLEDAAEVLSVGLTPQKALWQSYKKSTMRKTAFVDGDIAAMWGICGVTMGQIGRPWLLTTPAVEKVSPLFFARVYQKEVLEMLHFFPKLVNYVHADYTKAVRLLDIIGFTLSEAEGLGVAGVLFHRFEMRGK